MLRPHCDLLFFLHLLLSKHNVNRTQCFHQEAQAFAFAPGPQLHTLQELTLVFMVVLGTGNLKCVVEYFAFLES